MMNNGRSTTLNSWLKGVSSHLAVRRDEERITTRPKRNRDRERARREARRLFAQYYAEEATRHLLS